MPFAPESRRNAIRLAVRALGVVFTLQGLLSTGNRQGAIPILCLVAGLILLLLPDALL